jgi:hypothetical protein
MGVDFSHGNAHWSYSGFHNFRTKLARAISINLDEMQGFEKLHLYSSTGTGKPWDEVHDDLKILLSHSDCDGFLTAKDCRKIIPRLKDIIFTLDDDYDKKMCLELIGGMDQAVRKNENFEFC